VAGYEINALLGLEGAVEQLDVCHDFLDFLRLGERIHAEKGLPFPYNNFQK
jgi:hypothetical protein